MKTLKLITLTFVFVQSFVSFSATRTAVATGNWTSTSSWDCGCVPDDSDNVIIPNGIKITIPWPGVEMLHSAVVVITVYGELVLSSSTLSLNSNDKVIIASGGKISSSGLGGLITSGLAPITSFPINGPATITAGALPIVLNYFSAEEVADGVLVKWESAMEKNLRRYVIQRSANGTEFEDLETVDVSENSSVTVAYEVMDAHPRRGRSYYRLKAEDLDGSSETFHVVTVLVDDLAATIQVYPNPLTNGILTLDPNMPFSDGDYLVILTNLGKPVVKVPLSGFRNDFDLTTLEAGVYYIECRTAFGIFKKRLVRQ